MKKIIFSIAALFLNSFSWAEPASDLKVTILSTMIADYGKPEHATLGEWGFSALVEIDGRRLLFDTGRTKEAVVNNAQALGIDLSDVEDVVLSHFHDDHTGGLLALREQLTAINPKALSRLHVNSNFFSDRKYGNEPEQLNQMIAERAVYEKSGGKVLVYDTAKEIYPGVWISGPVPRVTDEKNFGLDEKFQVKIGNEWVTDTVPDSLSLYIETSEGVVVISGCGHAGLINIANHSEKVTQSPKINAAIGGFHLLSASKDQLAWTASKLKRKGIDHFIGAHCTGIEATHNLRKHLALPRSQMINGSVGTVYSIKEGITPTWIVR